MSRPRRKNNVTAPEAKEEKQIQSAPDALLTPEDFADDDQLYCFISDCSMPANVRDQLKPREFKQCLFQNMEPQRLASEKKVRHLWLRIKKKTGSLQWIKKNAKKLQPTYRPVLVYMNTCGRGASSIWLQEMKGVLGPDVPCMTLGSLKKVDELNDFDFLDDIECSFHLTEPSSQLKTLLFGVSPNQKKKSLV